MNKITYLHWRTEWKVNYLRLIKEIRKAKLTIKQANGTDQHANTINLKRELVREICEEINILQAAKSEAAYEWQKRRSA